MPKIKQSTTNSNTMFNLNGLDYKKNIWEIFYLDKEINSSTKEVNIDLIRVGIRNQTDQFNVLQHPSPVSSWVDGSGTPYNNLDTLVSDLSDLLGFDNGGGVGSVITVTQQVENYSSLVDGENIGEMSYVENSQGTSWLPSSLGGTYYPSGFYLWNGANWISDRNAIANQLEQSIINIDSKLDKNISSLPLLPTLLDTDKILVNRDGVDYSVDRSNLSSIQYPKLILHANQIDDSIPLHTGVVGNTLIQSFTIPANTIPANCSLRLSMNASFSKSTNYKFFYLYLNGTNQSLHTIINYATTGTNNNAFGRAPFTRDMPIIDGLMYVNYTAHNYIDALSVEATRVFDVTVDNIFYFAVNLVDASDWVQLRTINFEILK